MEDVEEGEEGDEQVEGCGSSVFPFTFELGSFEAAAEEELNHKLAPSGRAK